MKKDGKYRKILYAINRYLVFFLLMAFVITCCMMLFITVMASSIGIELTEEHINIAAKLTFGNVVLLSLLCTVIDAIRRKLTVDRPARRITEAAEKMMQGDFSVRIPPLHTLNAEDRFGEIAECFNKMAEELASVEMLRADFIANVSHEIKTPLSVIANYASILQSPTLSEEERKEYARIIGNAARNLSSLITNILKLNKLENQEIFPHTKVYLLGEQLCESLLAFESAWEEKDLTIETEIMDDVFVKTDEDMMTLVWNNLFSNAIKFSACGGKIKLTLTANETHAKVSISDEGCGISPEVGAHIFDKFYQGDTSHATQGNGLGLTLVKRVIDITGSDIAVESEVGKGSTFTVTLKRYTDE